MLIIGFIKNRHKVTNNISYLKANLAKSAAKHKHKQSERYKFIHKTYPVTQNWARYQ